MPSRPSYFAYGSNMDPVQMMERCPSACFVTIAELADHRLAFSRTSRKRRCGVADVLAAADCQVWGVVYSIALENDLAALDAFEGYRPGRRTGNSYTLHQTAVHPGGDPLISLPVFLYHAEKEANPPKPSTDYLGHLLRGAEHWGLPRHYRQSLAAIPTLAPGETK
jgi:gamma-glutamylcyclotransferase (GGCT)/AIG2-like uncharacterized protein YtfP